MEKLLDIATNTGLDAAKPVSKKVVHNAAEATGEFIGNKITEKIVNSADNSRNVEEISIPQEKREEIITELRKLL